MAFDPNKFIRNASSANSSAPLIHSYNGAPVVSGGSNDAAATITASGYFNAVADKLKVGDLVVCLNAAFVPGTPAAAMSNTQLILTAGPIGTVVTSRTISTAA